VTLGEPTNCGLFGIATNVHEWCAGWHDKDYCSRSPERNPAGPDQSKLDPFFRYNDYGFRVARSR
jgi:formylglycine-generating enzyme required for sulfatase activity